MVHNVTVTVNDDAGAALENALVYLRNTTTKEETAESLTNGSGQAVIDADAAFASGSSTGDVILIIAYSSNRQQHSAARYVRTGSSKAQTLQMNFVPFTGGRSGDRETKRRLDAILTANTHASISYFAKVYAINDAELLAHIETPASDSRSHQFGRYGQPAAGGFVVEVENVALIVTASQR